MDKKIDLKNIVQKSKNIRLLYVEDDTVLRNKTYLLLKLLFNHIDLAQNGLEAFEIYESKFNTENQFNLIITDINMPVLDGFGLSKRVLSLNPKQQIVVVSAYNDVDKLEEIHSLGIDNFLHKPIKEDSLLEMIDKVVGKIAIENVKSEN